MTTGMILAGHAAELFAIVAIILIVLVVITAIRFVQAFIRGLRGKTNNHT